MGSSFPSLDGAVEEIENEDVNFEFIEKPLAFQITDSQRLFFSFNKVSKIIYLPEELVC